MSDTTPLAVVEDLTDGQRDVLHQLALAFGGSEITRDEFINFGQALGVLRHRDVDNRPPAGHKKGSRGRAVPADWNRRGAVGA